MAEIEISKGDLENLLKKTQRMANINGKLIPQVKGTILYIEPSEVRTFNIVRDGTSSIASFCADAITSTPHRGTETIPVSDIALLLGAISKHTGQLSLKHEDGKLLIRSAHKQTTLKSSGIAQAFSHTKKTIAEWSADSRERYRHTIENDPKGYTLKNGDVVPESFRINLNSSDLYSAIESGSMNGQKVESYKFQHIEGGFCLIVGDSMKGKTHTTLNDSSKGDLVCAVGGGLEHILRTVKGEVLLSFFDLTPHGGGMSLRLSFDGGCVFQRESIHAAN